MPTKTYYRKFDTELRILSAYVGRYRDQMVNKLGIANTQYDTDLTAWQNATKTILTTWPQDVETP